MNRENLKEKKFLYPLLFLLLILIVLISGSGSDMGGKNGELDMNYGVLLLRMLFVLGGVIFLAVLIIRFVLPKIYSGNSSFDGEEIKIVGRKVLPGKNTLLLVRVRGKTFLLGLSENSIFKIAEFEDRGSDKFEEILRERESEVVKK